MDTIYAGVRQNLEPVFERGSSGRFMTFKIMELLNEHYNKLTKSEKKIADYLYNNLAEAQYMSITSLAETCQVAEATIFRFCRSLGFGGYNEFKLAIAKSFIQIHQAGEGNTDSAYGRVSRDDSVQEMCKKLCSAETGAIIQTMKLLEEQDILCAVDILRGAKKVYCLGQGGSLILSMAAWSRFASISPNFFCVEDAHLQAVTAALLNAQDAILLFSYSGATRDMLELLPVVKKNGVKVILVTHYKNSPAADYADVVLLCGSNEGPLQVGSVAAKVAQLFIIDVLYNQFWRSDPSQSVLNNEVTSAITAQKLL